ncbi:MAG: tetratricopeptide repeat protein 27-like [Promethearchaeota archaeon CR_4]|nr:MAG: tetratricopeptide repeat protein 27-like [Candidatus Lokiarchaeota archaeon CR_4]
MIGIPNPFQGTLHVKLDKGDAEFLSKRLEIIAQLPDWKKNDRCGLCQGRKTMGSTGETSEFGRVCPQCMLVWSFIMMTAGEFLGRFMNHDEQAGQALMGMSILLKEIGTTMPVVDEALKAEVKYLQGAFVLTLIMSRAKDPAKVAQDPQARDNLLKARQMLQEAYDISKRLNDRETISIYGYQLARAAQDLQDRESAIPLLEEGFVIDLEDKNPENVAKAALGLMQEYSAAGREDDLWSTYQKAAAIPGLDGLSTNHLTLIINLAIHSAIKTGNTERFAIALDAAKKSCTPEHSGAPAAQSRELEYTGQWHEARGNLQESRACYVQLLALFKQEDVAPASISRVTRRIKELDAKIQGVPFVDEETPEEWFEKSTLFDTNAKKLAYLQAGLEKSPGFHALAWMGIGKIHQQENRFQDATRAYEQSLKSDPKRAIVWFLLGMLRISVEDATGAREAFGKAIEIDLNMKQEIWNLATHHVEQAVLQKMPNMKEQQSFLIHWVLHQWGIDDLFSDM